MRNELALLAVAGRDPTGGAGVDADREAARALGVEARTVVTAETDQDGRRVRSVTPRPPDEWLAEALELLPAVAAIKSGLLPGADHVAAMALLVDRAAVPVVVDPVLAASGGEPFMDLQGVAALQNELIPRGPILTPNVPEAAVLSGLPLEMLADPLGREAAARILLAKGAAAVVLKGGHLEEDPVRDLVHARCAPPRWIAHERVLGASIHGSGCRHASALAAGLALGLDLDEAARRASRYLVERLRDSAAGS